MQMQPLLHRTDRNRNCQERKHVPINSCTLYHLCAFLTFDCLYLHVSEDTADFAFVFWQHGVIVL